MTAIPPVPTAAIGQQISANWWNNYASNPIEFLMNPPACDVANAAGVSLANGTATLMVWDTEYNDTWNMHSTATNPSRVTAIYPGRYEVNCYITLPSGITVTQFDINPRVNAAGSSTGGTSIRTFNAGPANGTDSGPREGWIHFTRVFAENDYVEVFVTQSSGAARTTASAGVYCTGFQMRWVGTA